MLFKKKLKFWVTDESRFGLMSWLGRRLTKIGVAVVAPYQQKFKNMHLFGLACPQTGESSFQFATHCNGVFFKYFLEKMAKEQHDYHHVVLCDNASYHHSVNDDLPENMALLFQPAYTPEVNPAEKNWRSIKDKFANQVFETLEDMTTAVESFIKSDFTTEAIQKLTQFDFIMQGLALLDYS